MINAGKYNRKVSVYQYLNTTDNDGFKTETRQLLKEVWAEVKTTKGYTLIASNSDFEGALTRFVIRYSSEIETAYRSQNRRLEIDFKNNTYTIEYFNNIDDKDVEIELQCKKVVK